MVFLKKGFCPPPLLVVVLLMVFGTLSEGSEGISCYYCDPNVKPCKKADSIQGVTIKTDCGACVHEDKGDSVIRTCLHDKTHSPGGNAGVGKLADCWIKLAGNIVSQTRTLLELTRMS